MANFMPVDDQKANALIDKLSRTIFQSPDDFVNYYNSGLINRKHTVASSIASELVATYRNVREQGGKIVFISKNEIFIAELLSSLADWEVIVKVKRNLKALLADETLTENDVIVFNKDSVGHFTQEGDGTRLNSEKLYSKHDDILRVYHKVSSFRNEGGDEVLKFIVKDFMRIEDSFIEQMRNLLP